MAGVDPAGDIVADILTERRANRRRWGVQRHPDGTGGNASRAIANLRRSECDKAAERGAVTWRHILREEVAEALAEADGEKLRGELVQVAAVCLAWIECIDNRAESARLAEQFNSMAIRLPQSWEVY